MTAFTSNLILVIMAFVWAWLSISTGGIFPVSYEFMSVGLVLAGPEAIKTYRNVKGK